MEDHVWGAGIVIAASLFNAAFAIPMRYNRVWKWENTWLVFCLFSLIVFPWLFVFLLVRGAGGLLTSLSLRELAPAVTFGFLWGIAQATFGLAILILGVSVALPIVGAFSIVLGSFTPVLAERPGDLVGKLGVVLVISAGLLVIGLNQYGRAARMREPYSSPKRSSRGLFLALLTGVLGGAINVGFALSKGILQRAEALGNSPTTSTYAVWVIVLAAGFLPNAVYCSYLLRKQGTAKGFAAPNMSGDFLRAFLMAVMWILGTTLYGIATTHLGRYGTSLGYLTYGSCSILFASVLGWKAGEWKNAPPVALRAFWTAMAVILASVVVLGLAA